MVFFYFSLSFIDLLIHFPSYFTTAMTGASIFDLLVSVIYPFMTISSIIKCAFSMLNIMSNSQTFSKYLSRVSTKLWMNSSKPNSFYLIKRKMINFWLCLTYDVLIIVDSYDEIERRISSLNYFILSMF